MQKEIIVELIKIAPSVLLYTALLILFLRYRKSIVETILPKVSNFKAFGIEATFVKEGIENAARSQNRTDVQVSPALMQRISHYPKKPMRLLWVDDNPDTVMYETGILQNLSFQVEFAKTSANALEKLSTGRFKAMISDISRSGDPKAGLDLLEQMKEQKMLMPVIFYIARLDRSLPTPIGSFGITDDPNELIHLVLDAAERMEGAT